MKPKAKLNPAWEEVAKSGKPYWELRKGMVWVRGDRPVDPGVGFAVVQRAEPQKRLSKKFGVG